MPELDLSEVLETLAKSSGDAHMRINWWKDRLLAVEEKLVRADLREQAQKLATVSKMHAKVRRVVFIGRSYFGDNIKYAFLDFMKSARANNCDAWFLPPDDQQEAIVKAAGFPCFPSDFLKWTSADIGRAFETPLVVNCDHNYISKWKDPRIFGLFQGTKQVQLWHGIPIKEVGFKYVCDGSKLNMHYCEILETCGPFDVLVGTAQKSEPGWKRYFVFNRFEAAGYPRNDVLLREHETSDLINVDRVVYERVKNASSEGKPVILYAPTFRDNANGDWFPPAGFAEIVTPQLAQKAHFIINLHPFEHHVIPMLEAKHPNLTFLRPGTDVYPILRYADAMITDYSSLIFDYLLLDKPIILYRPDHEQYQAASRPLLDSQLSEPTGPSCMNASELATAINDLLQKKDTFGTARKTLRKTWFDHVDAKAAERVTKIILSLLPEN